MGVPWLQKSFVRFIGVGAFNTVFSFTLFAILADLLGIHYVVSLVIVWTLSLLLTYALNFSWSFRLSKRPACDARLLRYTIVYLVGFVLNSVMMAVAIDLTGASPTIAQAIILPIVIAVNYTGTAYWALRQQKHEGRAEPRGSAKRPVRE